MNIERAVEEETSNKFFYIAIAVVLVIFLALGSYIYFSKGGPLTLDDMHKLNMEGKLDEERGYIFNGFSFVFFDGLWWTEIQDRENVYTVPLHFGPREVGDVTLSGELDRVKFNQGEKVYIMVNPYSDNVYTAVAASELAQNIVTVVKRQPIAACDQNETSYCSDRPVLSCDSGLPIIYLVDETGPEIEYSKSCIILKGREADMVKAANALIWKWYNIDG